MADTTSQLEQAVVQLEKDAERMHKVVNGTASETVVTEDGSTIPTIRKAFADNLFFITPPLPWVAGTQATVFNQLYAFSGSDGVRWWYAPGATASSPVTLPANPANSNAWRVYSDASSVAGTYAPLNSPIFTGNPQTPTPADDNNSQTIANTTFVINKIAQAIAGISGGSASYTTLTVSGATTLNNTVVNGTTIFKGPVNGDDVNSRFQNVTLTKQNSSLIFDWTDADNPGFLKTQLSPYTVQTHNLRSDVILNGVASADNTTMSLTGLGNNVFDYVYVKGNSSKGSTEPRLKVSGMTELENLRITGAISGVSFSVDGKDISPNSVSITQNLSVGTDIVVNGNANMEGALSVASDLSVTGMSTLSGGMTTNSATISQLTVTGASNLVGGFTTGAVNSTVGGNLSVTGDIIGLADISVAGDIAGATLNVSGDVDLKGTTKVKNLAISGSVTGLNVDLSGQNINVSGVTSSGLISSAGGISAQGASSIQNLNTQFISSSVERVATPDATWVPSGSFNVYAISVVQDTVIGAWPGLGSSVPAFEGTIYLTQDDTGGHSVTLDSSYAVLNSDTINTAADSVTILKLTYSGAGSVIDVLVYRRPVVAPAPTEPETT